MFRLIRLIIFVMVAFTAGVFWERFNMGERCESAGGEPRGGVCVDISQ